MADVKKLPKKTLLQYLTGDVLPNGACVVDMRMKGNDAVILAHRKDRTTNHPWVTWRCPVNQPAATWGGNYFTDLADAAKDMKERAEL